MVLVTEKDITFIAIQKSHLHLHAPQGTKFSIFNGKRPPVSSVDSFIVVDQKALTKSFHAYIVRMGNEISYPIKKDLWYQEKNPHEIFQISKNLVASISA